MADRLAFSGYLALGLALHGRSGRLLRAFCTVVAIVLLLATPVSADLRTNPTWWDQNAVGTAPDWHYRVPITFSGGAGVNSTVKVDVDFNTLLSTMGISGTFDVNSPRILRPNGTLAARQEFSDTVYNGATDAAGNGRGEIRFLLEDVGATYQLYFDITQNGAKPANPQTPINGNFERGAAGTSQPVGWNAPTGLASLDAQVRPSESVSVTSDGFLAAPNPKAADGSPNTGSFSYLIGARSANEASNGSRTITRTFAVPSAGPGSFTIRWRTEGWDSSGFDLLNVTLSSGATTINVVGPAGGSYASAPYSPNFGSSFQTSAASGNRPYNNFDMTSLGAHTQGMTVAAQAEPWWTRSVSLASFAGQTVTLTITSNHMAPYRSWAQIDDIEWSVVNGALGPPQAFGVNIVTPISGNSLVGGNTVIVTVQVDAAPTNSTAPMTAVLFNASGSSVRTVPLFNDGTHGDAIAGDALWTNDGSVSSDKLNIPPSASGNGWILRVYGKDSSTSTVGAQNGLVRGPGTGAAPETQPNYWNIDEIPISISTGALTVAKTSSVVSDPFNNTTNPKRIPGATILYCVLITNTSNGSLTSIVMTDSPPPAELYVAGSLRSGSACNNATIVEDDNNTGADESDPIGASFAAGTIRGVTATLAKNTGFVIAYRVTVR